MYSLGLVTPQPSFSVLFTRALADLAVKRTRSEEQMSQISSKCRSFNRCSVIVIKTVTEKLRADQSIWFVKRYDYYWKTPPRYFTVTRESWKPKYQYTDFVQAPNGSQCWVEKCFCVRLLEANSSSVVMWKNKADHCLKKAVTAGPQRKGVAPKLISDMCVFLWSCVNVGNSVWT